MDNENANNQLDLVEDEEKNERRMREIGTQSLQTLQAINDLRMLIAELEERPTCAPRRIQYGAYGVSNAESLKSRIYSPFLEGLISELNERFSPHFTLASKICLLLPNLVTGTSFEDLRETFEFYAAILPYQDSTLFETEYEAWKCKWVEETFEDDLMTVLDSCEDEFFPIIRALLQILATLPVSTATPERTFPSLKILKTYLRNSMTKDRLAGLALLYIHRTVVVNVEEVVDDIKQNRRISFT